MQAATTDCMQTGLYTDFGQSKPDVSTLGS